jgi:DNA-binding MarR family transcriptional regulator
VLDDLEDRPPATARRRRAPAAAPAPRPADAEDLSAQTLRQLLLRRSTWLEERIFRSAPRFGYGFVTPAMHRLFTHMPRKPVSMSELARRLAVSRQAVHQTVAEACRRGILELVEDPSDARVRKVRFTDKGLAMVRTASQSVKTIEAELERRLGPRDFAALRRILSRHW